MTNLRSLSDLFRATRKLAVACAFVTTLAAAASAQTQTNKLEPTGNAGIGTTNPGEKLVTIGNVMVGNINGHTQLYSGYDGQTPSILEVGYGTATSEITPFSALVLSKNATGTAQYIGSIFWANRAIADGNEKRLAQIAVSTDGATNSGLLTFNLTDAGTLAERMRITKSGNVGIGTSAPGAKLEIDGSGLIRVTEGSRVVPTSGVGLELSANSSGSFVGAYNRGTASYRRLYFYGAPYVFEAGNVGIGVENPQYKLDVAGDIKASGTIYAKYQDLAEWVPSSEQLSAGTVVVLDTTKSNQVVSATVSYDTRVAGVISAQPGITLGEKGDGKVLVATTGRVKVKVDATKAPIQIGDLLVTSDIPGVAMKSEPIEIGGRKMHMPGTIVGKALEPLAKGKGEILVLLSLQ